MEINLETRFAFRGCVAGLLAGGLWGIGWGAPSSIHVEGGEATSSAGFAAAWIPSQLVNQFQIHPVQHANKPVLELPIIPPRYPPLTALQVQDVQSSPTETETSAPTATTTTTTTTKDGDMTLKQFREGCDDGKPWTVYNGAVYDLGRWFKHHPGGGLAFAVGKDISSALDRRHPDNRIEKLERVGALLDGG